MTKKQTKLEKQVKLAKSKPAKYVQNGTAGSGNAAVKVAKKGSKFKLLIGAAVVLVLLAAAILLLTGGNAPQAPSFNPTSSPVPSAFQVINGSAGSLGTLQLAMLAQAGLSNASQFTVLYSGSITAKVSVLGISSPLDIADYKYGKSQRFWVNATSVEGFGPVKIVYSNTTSGTLSCTNLNVTAISTSNYDTVLFGSRLLNCTNSEYIDYVDLSKLSNFNFSQLSSMGVYMSYSTVYQSSYNGTPCTYVAGTISAPASGWSGVFQECVSDVYYVPLSIYIYASSKYGSVTVLENETYISNSSSLSLINQGAT